MAEIIDEDKFSTDLLSTDVAIRDAALEKLREYVRDVRLQKGNYHRLWEVLFQCMWNCDKPQNQKRLSQVMVSLVDEVPLIKKRTFIAAFYRRTTENWHQIDSHRMNKYLFLLRLMHNRVLQYLVSLNGERQLFVFGNMLAKEALQCRLSSPAIGPALQHIDTFLEEYRKVVAILDAPLTAVKRFLLFRPFFLALQKSTSEVVPLKITKEIFGAATDDDYPTNYIACRILLLAADPKASADRRDLLYSLLSDLDNRLQTANVIVPYEEILELANGMGCLNPALEVMNRFGEEVPSFSGDPNEVIDEPVSPHNVDASLYEAVTPEKGPDPARKKRKVSRTAESSGKRIRFNESHNTVFPFSKFDIPSKGNPLPVPTATAGPSILKRKLK